MKIYNSSDIKNQRKRLRKESTPQEIILWSRLRNNQLGAKFKRQYSVASFIVDFCSPKQKLIIEIDGSQHIDNAYDIERTKILESLGFQVIRFWNNEVNENLEGVILKILNTLPRPLPR